MLYDPARLSTLPRTRPDNPAQILAHQSEVFPVLTAARSPCAKNALATQNPSRRTLSETSETKVGSHVPSLQSRTPVPPVALTPPTVPAPVPLAELKEKRLRISYGDTGFTYESLFGDYLRGAKEITVEDPYIRVAHQFNNFLRFCELVVKVGAARVVNLTTGYDDEIQRTEAEQKLKLIGSSLLDHGIKLNLKFSETLHDREIRLDNGWTIQIGRGFDIYQKSDNWLTIGATDLEMRPCMETKVDIYRRG